MHIFLSSRSDKYWLLAARSHCNVDALNIAFVEVSHSKQDDLSNDAERFEELSHAEHSNDDASNICFGHVKSIENGDSAMDVFIKIIHVAIDIV